MYLKEALPVQLNKQERQLLILIMIALITGAGITIYRNATDTYVEIQPSFPGGSTQRPGDDTPKEPTMMVVHVTGAVCEPGVYTLSEGSRLADAVHAAGGLTDDSDPERINLAAFIADGQQILVPRRKTDNGGTTEEPLPGDGKIRINSATASELETLPGIGPVLAERIIHYRNQYGPFRDINDLRKVPGVGDKKLAEIAPFVVLY
jgi:competence protein ComEA